MKAVRLICLLAGLMITGELLAQLSPYKKPKKSVARGTLYGYWGYNRSGYTKSNIRFVGPGYDFTMNGSVAHDNPTPFKPSVYFNPKLITVPQFNARMGYYFSNHFSISLGYDHMKYIFADRNQVLLNGTITPGTDTVTDWSGSYTNFPVTTDRNTFHYENSNGLNYIRLGLERTDNLYQIGDWFMLSSIAGIGSGALLSFNDFKFAGKEDRVTVSLSGYGLSAHAGLRFEFFKHFFVQTDVSGGFMHQLNVKTRANEPNAFARHAYGYIMFDTVLGFLLYIRPTNDCNSCPVW
ncbi:MAG: hypothetical protein ACK45H_12155 [Bacteroidota bacterium]